MLEKNPTVDPYEIIYQLYPYKIFLKDAVDSVETLLSKFNKLTDLVKKTPGNTKTYIDTDYQNEFIGKMVRTVMISDFCIVGPNGSGKNMLVNEMAQILDREVENIVLYQDMTSRDLVQQRTTLDNGDTVWNFSPLVSAALEGRIAILDGIDRIHPSTLTVLHRLIQDRELQLHDGRRLISSDRYEFLQKEFNLTEEQLKASGVLRIHSDFRIIAIGEPPNTQSKSGNWLSPEMLSLFVFHELRTLSKHEETHIVTTKFGPLTKSMHRIIDLAHVLRATSDQSLKNLSGHLSTRQLLRIAARIKHYPSTDPYEIIQETFMIKFLPSLTKQALEKTVQNIGIVPTTNTTKTVNYEIKNNILTIGESSAPLYNTENLMKVPNILFYDVPQHLRLMEKLLQDFQLGHHLLLVGNQGVGKNKIADRFLQLLNRPREYIQLHRDTTVQTLTTQPTVKDGVLVHEDSPLVKAVKFGHVLVIDEADKAPTHVTCILKTLVESGQMILSDGRRIASKVPAGRDDENYIEIHPDFRIIVLANRPGFPFLGNDFFGALGDLFSSHSVDNPSQQAEIELLKRYGPDVPIGTVERLVEVFGDLRTMADQGLLSYPYSTREVVNIVKHLQEFPDSDIEEVIFNIFDFDKYTPELTETLGEVLVKHGFSSKNIMTAEYVAAKRAKENIQVTVKRYSGKETNDYIIIIIYQSILLAWTLTPPSMERKTPTTTPTSEATPGLEAPAAETLPDWEAKGAVPSGQRTQSTPDEEKASVPEHVQRAAREMGRKAFQEKLKEIGMSGYDHSVYSQFSDAVSRQVQSLRVILGNLQAKNKERQWSRHQTSGELDDVKLIDGLLGEKTIYRRRSEQEPELGTPQTKPKHFRVVVDVSGSMYRFNSYDGRLDRELEAVVLVMEAFESFGDKIKYDIIGHSGEASHIVFVSKDGSPKNNKERLEIIRVGRKTMHAHAQYCWSGDHTLEATEQAISSLAEEDCDEAILVVMSDANLQRYGIPPSELAAALTSKPNVSAYTVFIGSLGDQAERLLQKLPAGRAFICNDTKELPQILKQIFFFFHSST
ncbi:hypothetical protein NQ317_008368 [Molorchus minor]|uniref:VWFA domain-containing protein n=1 Tax=Molorchus minor TaxID=1323400 RepID=A0ABQ9K5Q3_9CUCU|nr:hypothetical protein NQ317_008368 [Molorchus minor]